MPKSSTQNAVLVKKHNKTDGKNIIKAKTETLQEMNETKIPYYRIEEYQQRLTNNLQKKGIVMAYKEYDIIINTEQEIYTWNVENVAN